MAENISDEKLNKLLSLNKKLVLEDNFTKKIGLISNSVKEIIRADRCTIFIHDNGTKSLWSIYIDGISYLEIPDDMGIASEVFQTKKTIIENDAQNSDKFNNDVDKGTGYTTKSILSVPILGYGGKILGVLQLINKLDHNSKFEDSDVEILNYVMSNLSAFLELMILHE